MRIFSFHAIKNISAILVIYLFASTYYTRKIYKQLILKNFSCKNSFCSYCVRASIKSKQKTMLSEKTVFENLADMYNCIFLIYFSLLNQS